MLVDEVVIKVRAGHGGAGKVSFGRAFRSGPDGGNGGRGGDVYLTATSDLTALGPLLGNPVIEAERGADGGSKTASGKAGKDVIWQLPLGTEATDTETGEQFVIDNMDTQILICKGGLGGRGNAEFKSGQNTRPMYAQPGLDGQKRELYLSLKFLADFGLVGLPNAGKSSLLNALTRAHARVGNYPFTTTEANLGVLGKKVLADIPGLIEGAANGKGLGIKFLKHIEKVTAIIHCISCESEDICYDYETIEKEMANYGPELADKKRIIFLTKIDLYDEKTIVKQEKLLKKYKLPIYRVSVYQPESVEKIAEVLLGV